VSKVTDVNNRPLAERLVGSWKLMSYQARSDEATALSNRWATTPRVTSSAPLTATCRRRRCARGAAEMGTVHRRMRMCHGMKPRDPQGRQ
jgi:hypothetical protein